MILSRNINNNELILQSRNSKERLCNLSEVVNRESLCT